MRRALPAALLVVAACARGDLPPRRGPSIAFDAAGHDFGVVAAGTELRHRFEISNRGERPLRLDSMRAGCGCRLEGGGEDVVPPQGRMVVGVACDTSGLSGRQRRTLTVHANDAERPVTVLALEADVRASIAAVPPELYFGRAAAGQRTDRDLRLVLQDPGAVPRRAGSELGMLSPALERRSDAEWRVVLRVAPDAPAGVVRDRLVIETASSDQPRLVVPVTGIVVGEARP